MAFSISLLRDNFTDDSISPAWGGAGAIGSATVAETGGQARFTLPSSTAGTHQAYYRTLGTYDLTGDGCFWTIGTMVATGVAATAFFDCYIDGTNLLRWIQTSGTLKAQNIVAGVTNDMYTIAWNASTYKYLRIRESAGSVYFDSSTNGTIWTNRVSTANPFAVTALYIQFGATCGNIASPGSLRVDEFNIILPLSSDTWRETTADWSIVNRLRPVTLAGLANAECAIVTADTMDSARVLGGTLRYFAGPLGSTSGGYLALTEYASLALAQASAFPMLIDGRVDLPAFVDARYMRLYHRSTDGAGHSIREFVPRRIVQADDIEAESIRAINIAAGAITADKIFVLTLSAITADVGVLTGGVIDGVTIYAGGAGHPVTLDATGVSIVENASGSVVPNAVTWYEGVEAVSYITTTKVSAVHAIRLVGGDAGTTRTGRADILALGKTGFADTTRDAELDLIGSTSAGVLSSATLSAHAIVLAGADSTTVTGGNLNVSAGVNVGAATAATTGQVFATVLDGLTATASVPLQISHHSTGTPTTNFGVDLVAALHSDNNTEQQALLIRTNWATATDASRKAKANIFIYDTAARSAITLQASGTAAMIGFLGAGAIVRPTVTGSRGANAALASALSALASLGLIVDSSS